MGIKDFIASLVEKRKKFKDYSDDVEIQEKVSERKKTADERELERFMEEDRQKRITTQLKQYRKRKFVNDNYGNQILTPGPSICNNESMLKYPNLFKNEKRQFFKW